MEYHAINDKVAAHVMTTHRGNPDETPLQLISVQEIERMKALEQAVRALVALLPPAVEIPDLGSTAG